MLGAWRLGQIVAQAAQLLKAMVAGVTETFLVTSHQNKAHVQRYK